MDSADGGTTGNDENANVRVDIGTIQTVAREIQSLRQYASRLEQGALVNQFKVKCALTEKRLQTRMRRSSLFGSKSDLTKALAIMQPSAVMEAWNLEERALASLCARRKTEHPEGPLQNSLFEGCSDALVQWWSGEALRLGDDLRSRGVPTELVDTFVNTPVLDVLLQAHR